MDKKAKKIIITKNLNERGTKYIHFVNGIFLFRFKMKILIFSQPFEYLAKITNFE